MNLYHGSDMIITNPDCLAGRDNLDFGRGFYTTIMQKHAEQWARQVAFNHGVNPPIVNVYDFDKNKAIKECRYLFFPEYNEAWMDFIVLSRQGKKPWVDFDLIEGGIANDRVIDTIRLYMYGEMEKATALKRLSEHQPNHQMCFLNQDLVNKYLIYEQSFRL